MAAFTIDQFIAIERDVHAAEVAAGLLGGKETKANLRSAAYLLAVIRSHAQTYADATPAQNNAEIGLSLLSALYH